MDESTKKLRSKIKKQAQVNRTNRVQKSANQYNGGKLRKSHLAYINGDYMKTASMREYGYKQNPQDFKGVTYYTGGRSRTNYEKLQNGYNPYQVRYLKSNYQSRNYVPAGISKSTGKPYDAFYSNKILLNKNQLNAINAYGKLTPQTLTYSQKAKEKRNKYSILSPSIINPKNFGQTLNTPRLDGLRVARNKGGGLHYLAGGAKDFILDPLVDLLKGFDRYESSALNAGLGGIQSLTELADAVTKKGTKLSDVNWGHAKENWKHSINTSNRIGFGDSSGESIKKIIKGTQQRQLKEYQQGGNSLTNWWESKFTGKPVDSKKFAKEYEKKINSSKTKRDIELGSLASGLFLDIANPAQIGSKVMPAVAKVAKKGVKDIKNGNKAVGVVSDPEGIEWLNKISKQVKEKYSKVKPKTSYVDELFHETEQQNKARKALSIIDDEIPYSVKRQAQELDDAYIRNMQKVDKVKPVKKVVDAKPETKNLSHFLDEIEQIDASNSKQMDLWKRIRKNKRMTKDGYVPNAINRADDVIQDVSRTEQIPGQINVNEVLDRPRQIDMFDRLGISSEERFVPNSQNIAEQVQKELHPSTEKTIQQTIEEYLDYGEERKMTNLLKLLDENGEDIFKYVDELDDYHADRMMDYLERYEPELYNKYIGNVDEYIDPSAREKATKAYQDEQAVKNIINKKEVSTTKNIDREYFRKSNEAYELEKIFNNNKTMNVDDIAHRKTAFDVYIKDYVERLRHGDINIKAVNKVTKRLKQADIPIREKVRYINNNLFDGNKVISDKVSKKTLDSFLDSLEDVHKVAENSKNYAKGIADDFNLSNLSENTQKFLNNLKSTNIYDVQDELTKSVLNRSKALIDSQYNNKMSYLAHKFKYNYIDDVRNEVKQLKERRRYLDGFKKTKDVIDEQTALSARIKELNNTLDLRDAEWEKLKHMSPEQFQKYLMNEMDYLVQTGDYNEYKRLSNFIETKMKDNNFNNNFLNSKIDIERDTKELNAKYADEARHKVSNKSNKKDYLQKAHYKTIDQQKELTPGIYNEYVNKVAELDKYYDDLQFVNRQGAIERTNSKFLKSEDTEYVRQIQNELKTLEDTSEVMKKFGLNEPKYKKGSAKYHKSVNRGKLPEVQDNLGELKHLLEQEADMAIKNPSEYKKYGDAILAVKRDYINAIRSYGVDTKLIKNNANQYLKDIIKSEKNPVNKMNLQMLANNTMNQIDDVAKPNGSLIDRFKNKFKPSDSSTSNTKPLDNVTESSTKPHTSNKPNKPNTKPHNKPNNNSVNTDALDNALDDFIDNNPNFKPDTYQTNVPKPDKPVSETIKETNQNKNNKKNNPIFDLYKRYLNTYKKGVTVYNPGWHLANFLQNKGQNYLAIGGEAFAPQTQARKMLDFIKGKTNKIDDIVLNDGTKISGEDVARFAEKSGVAEGAQSTQIMSEPRTLLPKVDEFLDNTKLLQRLSRNEETARLHHYLTQIKRGMSKEDAVKSVNKYLFDYANKSKSERAVENFIDPFWTFHKNYLKLGLNQALTNPSKVNNILRVERELTNSTDESNRNQNASESKFQLPIGSFKDDKNNARYDYMWKQYIFPEIQNAIPLEYNDVEGKLNPLLKLAIQQARGRGDFDTKVVDKKKADWNEITKADRNKEILYDINPFVNVLGSTIKKSNSYTERNQSKKTTDLQKLETWLNFITGNKGKHERYLDFLK